MIDIVIVYVSNNVISVVDLFGLLKVVYGKFSEFVDVLIEVL